MSHKKTVSTCNLSAGEQIEAIGAFIRDNTLATDELLDKPEVEL